MQTKLNIYNPSYSNSYIDDNDNYFSLQVIGAVSELEHGVYSVDYCPAVGAVAVTTGAKLHVAVPTSRLPVFITQED